MTDAATPAAKRTNYALREEALGLRTGNARAPTAVLTHGANPGMVSHLVKQALLNIAGDLGIAGTEPASRADWAELAQRVGMVVVRGRKTRARRDGAREQALRVRCPARLRGNDPEQVERVVVGGFRGDDAAGDALGAVPVALVVRRGRTREGRIRGRRGAHEARSRRGIGIPGW